MSPEWDLLSDSSDDESEQNLHVSSMFPIDDINVSSNSSDLTPKPAHAQCHQDFEDFANSFNFQQFMMSDGWQSHNVKHSNVGNFSDFDPCQACDDHDDFSNCEDCNFSCFSETSLPGYDGDQQFLLELLLKPDGTSFLPTEAEMIQEIIEIAYICGSIDHKTCEKLFQKFPELSMPSHLNLLQAEPLQDPPAQQSNLRSKVQNNDKHGHTVEEHNTQEHKQLEAQVCSIYSLWPQLPVAANQCLFPITLDE